MPLNFRRLLGPGTAFAVAACGLTILVSTAPLRGQETRGGEAPGRGRGVAALDPDTVRVGERFTLGVSVAAGREDDVQFPALLPLEGQLEQIRAPDVRWDRGAGSWRAYYQVVAWKEGDWALPTLSVETTVGDVDVSTPMVHVTSVLPASPEMPLQLESPRTPRPIGGFPWWLLLLLLAAALLWWLSRRLRRDEVEEAEELIDPAVAVREAIDRLKEELEGGGLDLAAFYDGLERVVRHYLASRWGWSEVLPVREFVRSRGGASGSELRDAILSMEGRAGLVRFAHLQETRDSALRDADTCLEWVTAEEAA